MTLRDALLRLKRFRAFRLHAGRAQIIGYVDHIDRSMIRGWAFDAGSPSARLPLDVFYKGVFLGAARTGGFRQDLADGHVGDGRHGFVFHLPSDLVGDVGPDDIEVISSRPTAAPLIVIGRTIEDGTDLDLHETPASFFLPLIARLSASPRPDRAAITTNHRRAIEPLFVPAGGNSAFTEHLAIKHGRSSPNDDPHGFWRWYLNVYAAFKPNLRPPLSERDSSGVTALIALERRMDGKRDDIRIATLDPTFPRAYAWAVIEARRLGVEDRLVDALTRQDMSRISWPSRSVSFPLSRFMRIFCEDHRILRHLGRRTSAERVTIYALVMLLALHDPHYLQFVPQAWLARMLETDSGKCRFEQAQATLFDGRYLSRARFLDQLTRRGFDPQTGQLSGTHYGAHRIEGGSTIIDGAAVDVQLIGPFRRSLGLAESCRRLAAALSRIPFTVAFTDYDIGFASEGAEPEVDLSPLRAARINILHLNAEEIPEAIGLMPDTFSHSHIVAVPYWELNRPAKVHELGLAMIDEVWAATHYLERVFAGAGAPTCHIGMCVDDRFQISDRQARAFLSTLGVPPDAASILTTADALSWTQRKNLTGAISAFETAFADDPTVRLIVKTRNADKTLSAAQTEDWDRIVARCAADPRIVLVDAALSDRDHKVMLSGVDCLLSLHRAEGLGLDILDALHLGTPVVATAYSGNMDYCDDDTAWLVDFKLQPVSPDDYVFVEDGHVWAEPDVDHAALALRSAVRDRGETARKSAAGRQRVSRIASLDAFAARLADIVDRRLRATSAS